MAGTCYAVDNVTKKNQPQIDMAQCKDDVSIEIGNLHNGSAHTWISRLNQLKLSYKPIMRNGHEIGLIFTKKHLPSPTDIIHFKLKPLCR